MSEGMINVSLLRRLVKTPLSGDDMQYFLPGALVVKYGDLSDISSLAEVFVEYSSLVILFESEPGFGHWVIVFPVLYGVEGEVEFFDSYSSYPDDNLAEIDPSFRKVSSQYYPKLTELLLTYPGDKMHINEVSLQASGNVMTCGRWCCLRWYLRDLTPKAFARVCSWLAKSAGLTPDEMVCYVVRRR